MLKTLTVAIALLALLLAAPATASAWANGPRGDGFGTHDWLLERAVTVDKGRGQAGWLDLDVALKATDDPDTRLHDTVNHVYDTTERPVYGNAPGRVAELYARAVAQLRAGDARGASETIGLMSHYYTDVNNPLHTDQTDAEHKIHARYEAKVLNYTNGPGENAGWVTARTFVRVIDPAEFTRQAAAAAAPSYSALVSEFSSRGFDTRVRDITRASLDRAANGLADLIGSAELDAKGAAGDAGDPAGGDAGPDPPPSGPGSTSPCPGPALLAAGLVLGGTAVVRRRGR